MCIRDRADVAAHLDAGPHLDAERRDDGKVAEDDLSRQPPRGDLLRQAAADRRLLLEDGDAVPVPAQVVGGEQPGGAGADDRDRRGAVGLAVEDVVGLALLALGEEPLDVADAHRAVLVDALAVQLAGVGADVPEGAGERQLLAHELERLGEAALGGELHVAAGIDLEPAAGEDLVGQPLRAWRLRYLARRPPGLRGGGYGAVNRAHRPVLAAAPRDTNSRHAGWGSWNRSVRAHTPARPRVEPYAEESAVIPAKMRSSSCGSSVNETHCAQVDVGSCGATKAPRTAAARSPPAGPERAARRVCPPGRSGDART